MGLARRTNMNIFSEIMFCLWQNYYLLFLGLLNTLGIWIASAVISFFLGLVWGIGREKKIFHFYVVFFANAFAYLLQGIPFYLQLLISYFIVGPFLQIDSAIVISIIALGICSASYTSQIILSAIQTIPDEQWYLASGLGYTKYQTVTFIILPQIMNYTIPLFINECDQLIKSISILSTIGILELTRSGLNIINITFKPLPVYIILASVYLFCSLLLRYIADNYKKKINIMEIKL